MKKEFGHLVRILHWCNHQNMTHALEEMDLTAAQGHVMGFLAHRESAPCPRDIESAFHLSHPTVSGILSRLEQKGFIELRTDQNDRRCKRIYVLPKGRECQEMMYATIMESENRIIRGFSPEEQTLFAELLQRAISNMGEPPQEKCKEEENE